MSEDMHVLCKVIEVLTSRIVILETKVGVLVQNQKDVAKALRGLSGKLALLK